MNIRHIKNYLATKVGARIMVVYYGSRNRKVKYLGYLDKLYANVFTIKLMNGEVKSFMYIDIITKTIRICI
jgi:uncharacterized protein Veg